MSRNVILIYCTKPETVSDPSKITYSRDSRTGLCFGRYSVSTGGHGSESFSTTNVPFNTAVLALVPANQR